MRKDKFVIAFDCDDVLIDLLEYWVYWLNQAYHLNVKREDITDWDISLFFPSLTEEEIFEPLYSPNFWYGVKGKPNVKETIEYQKYRGHQVVVATASDISTISYKINNCLFRLYDCFDKDDIIVIKDKSLLNADVLIDDNPDNFNGFKGIRILMDSPHNQDPPPYSFDYRVKDIKEVSQIIMYHEPHYIRY